MEHSVNEYVEEEDEAIDGEGSEDGDGAMMMMMMMMMMVMIWTIRTD